MGPGLGGGVGGGGGGGGGAGWEAGPRTVGGRGAGGGAGGWGGGAGRAGRWGGWRRVWAGETDGARLCGVFGEGVRRCERCRLGAGASYRVGASCRARMRASMGGCEANMA